MRTTKPISTISFNTQGFLALKLDELVKAKKISFWAFVSHLPEDDEGGKKEHIHLYVEPSKMLQTDDLRDELKEPVFSDPAHPLGCLPFNSSKFDDWYLYACHDKGYLASKNQERKFHYSHSDFRSSEPDYLLFKARRIDRTSLSPYASMIEAQSMGQSWDEYFARNSGSIPIQQMHLFHAAFEQLMFSQTYRSDKSAHLVLTDEGKYLLPSTGELFDTIQEYERSLKDD